MALRRSASAPDSAAAPDTEEIESAQLNPPYQDPSYFEATQESTRADFLTPEHLQGTLPTDAEQITQHQYLCGTWKDYMLDDPKDKLNCMTERFIQVRFSDTNGHAQLVIDWSYVYDGSTGEGFEENAPVSVFAGSFSGRQLDALGAGRIVLTDFYYLNDEEYAIGTLIWPDGMDSFVSLKRP